tara:strand:+ start:3136 stop:3504 length:369 start_codon:yes stop_codon:yes gene_type:complete
MSVKIIHYIIAGLFFIFAAVQYNDADPFLWMLIYGSVALMAILKIWLNQINYRPMLSTLIVLYLLYSFVFIPSLIDFFNQPEKSELVGQMKATKPWIEETREILGLWISIGALIYMKKTVVK